jgi:hypothetical protein
MATESIPIHSGDKKDDVAVFFEMDEFGNFKVDLAGFNKEHFEILRTRVSETCKADDDGFEITITFANGNVFDGSMIECKVINDFISIDLVSCKLSCVKFTRCRFGLESLRAILSLATNSRRKLSDISMEECCIVESLDRKALEEEFLQRMAAGVLRTFVYSVSRSGDFKVKMRMWFSHINYICIHVAVPQVESGQNGDTFLPSEHVRMLVRLLQDIETLEDLDIGATCLSVDAIIQICRYVASLNRNINLKLGQWDVSNSAANLAVCELIRKGRFLRQLGLGNFHIEQLGLPIDILADALSSSLHLTYLSLSPNHNEFIAAIDYVEALTRRIKYPNRLKGVGYIFCRLRGNDSENDSLLENAENALNAKLLRMQTTQVFVLIALVYAVTTMTHKIGLAKHKDGLVFSCPLSLLNVDVLRKLAVFLW